MRKGERRPLSREKFRQLRRGEELVDRHGRTWTVTAPPYHQGGLDRVVIRSGDLVRVVDEWWAGDYEAARRWRADLALLLSE